MSSLLHNWECSIERNTNNTEELLKIAEDIYNTAYARGKASEERPKGKWIKDCDSCDCSHCYDSGARFTRKDCSGKCSNCSELKCCTDNFCPNCGADMRGGAE